MAETKKVIVDIIVNTSDATEGFDTVQKELDDTTKRVKTLKTETDKTSKSMGQGFTAGADAAALIPGPIGQAAAAVGGLKTAFDAVKASLVGVRIALVATGIGAFVVIVGTLVAYFMNTEKGAQSLRVAMAGLGAIVSNLVDAWLGLAKATYAFWTFDFKGAAKNLTQALDSATTGLVKNTEAAVKNAKALNDVEVAEGDLTVARAKANMEITKARLIADDLTKSTEERIEAVKRAAVIEREVAAEELRIAQIKAKALKEGVENKVDADEEERDIADQAAVRVFELQNETLRREKRLGSEIQSLKNEQATKDKEADAARLAEIKSKNEAELALAKKLAEEKEAALKASYENELRLAQEAADGKILTDEYLAERRAVTQEEILALEIERALAAEDAKFNAVMEALFAQNATKAQYEEAQLVYEQEQMVIANDLTAAFNEKKLTDAEKLEADLLKVQQDANAKKVEEEKKVKQARLMVAGQVANGLGAIGQLITQAQGEQTAASKAFAIGQLAINTAMSISEAIAGATTSATATGPGAFVATPLFIATSIATVLAAVGQATAILSSAPGGGSVSAPTASSVGATSAPSFSPVTTNTTQLGNTQQAELAPVQAYVVETQITGSQANINQIESQSTFGGG
jgi:hypothetical protein